MGFDSTGMFTPSDADSQHENWRQQIEARLEKLESATRLPSASIKGGALVVYNDDNQQVGRLGEGGYIVGSTAFERPVLSVSHDNGFWMLVDTEDGWLMPAGAYNWYPVQFMPITSAAWTDAWRMECAVTNEIFRVSIPYGGDAATTGEIRLSITGITPLTSDVFSVPASSSGTVTFNWDLRAAGYNFEGLRAHVAIEAQRLTGTGNINVWSPWSGTGFHSKSLVTGTDGGL